MKKSNTPPTPFSFFIFLFSFFILLLFCQKSTNPVQTGSLNMELLDVTCTEAFLGLEFDPGYVNKTLSLYRGDSLITSRPLSAADTILLAEGLWPNTNYEFKADITEGEKRLASSPALRVTTMDTTGHDFTWQSWEFGGQGGSSVFYDVAIIDANDIWAVGEIYTADDKYNAAHWDGEKWELKKLDWDGIVSRLTCVFAFSSDDVWFGVTNLIHWNGFTFEKNWNPVLNEFYDKTINKIWGTSGEDLYVVGNKGLIAHYDGREWRRIESGIDQNIYDIFGINNQILCVSSVKFTTEPSSLLRISNNKVEKYPWSFPQHTLHSVWFNNIFIIYTGGAGFFKKVFTQPWNSIDPLSNYYTERVRGQAQNDIIAVFDYLLISHYNGLNYKFFFPMVPGIFKSLDFKNNIVVAVGEKYGRTAIIKMGKR